MSISVYVDVSCTECIDLAFQLGADGSSTRQWSIKVENECADIVSSPFVRTLHIFIAGHTNILVRSKKAR